VLFLCALILLVIASVKKERGDRFTRHWFVLSAIFALMSLDETAAIREQTTTPIKNYLNSGGVFLFAWVIPALAFVVFAGLYFLRFLLSLDATTRRRFLLAGAVYVGGALGMEMVAGHSVSLPTPGRSCHGR
jgi:hypothetical protein